MVCFLERCALINKVFCFGNNHTNTSGLMHSLYSMATIPEMISDNSVVMT